MAAIGGIAGRINGDAFAALFPASYADSKLLAELYLESAAPACIDEPWLQPQYNHATGAMIGAEVLVRWNRNGTYISPAEFIPNVNDIDEFQKELKEGLLAKGIHSLILAPMWKDGRLIGFVGTDNPTRAVTHLVHLAALGDYLAVLLTRRDFPEQ